jgi:glyoxylase-like metal-dependent hydrolase (beta-lactamase superfamily II)
MDFHVGDIAVDVLVDIDRFELPIAQLLPEADPGQAESARFLLEPDHVDLERGMLILAIQTFVLRCAGRTILVDTCVGEGKERPLIPDWSLRRDSSFLERLGRTGVRPESVDLVFCTHMHVDHVGWNTRLSGGRWTPTFPNARYLIGRRELGYWQDQRRRPDGDDALHLGAFEDSVLPILAAGQADLVDDGYELGPGLSLVPLPGHTPGQMGLRLDGRARALFCGDAIHSPLQVLDPRLSTAGCVDREQARRVRRALLEEAAEEGRAVVPAHFRGTRYMHIQRTATGFTPSFPGRGH